jgi:hypothetical protein
MKTPTTGTEVFSPALEGPSSTARTTNYGNLTDLLIGKIRSGSAFGDSTVWDRMRGANRWLSTNATYAEGTTITNAVIGFDAQTGVRLGVDSSVYIQSTYPWVHWAFKRAAGFFDVVCYTGTGVARTVNHNLTVAPELMIVKNRGVTTSWKVYSAALGATAVLELNTNLAFETSSSPWNNTSPTSSVFTVGTHAGTNQSSGNLVAYLFATVAGVSKVGSYTGNGTTQTIDCGFTTGARFVLIKRTDSTGDWYVWDTARGISAGSDSHLSLNTTTAEVTSDDTIDANSSGFIVNQVAATNVNVNAATYIFLAIA